jgi:hypothetical protein
MTRRYRQQWLVGLLMCLWAGSASAQFGSNINICTPPAPPTISAAPTVVTTCTGAGIQAAIDSAGRNEDIHITFDCGGAATIDINSPLVLNDQDILLDGGGNITLDGGGTSRILEDPNVGDPNAGHYANDIILRDIRISNANAPAASGTKDNNARGGALNVGGPGTKLYIINSTFEGNRTRSPTDEDNQGGAVFVGNAFETVISGSAFSNNQAGNGGAFGGIATGLQVYNSRFINNQATDSTSGGIVRGHGGAIHLDGVTNNFNPTSNKTVDICGSTFSGNTAVRGGGAIKTTVSDGKGTKLTISDSSFVNNRLVGVPPTEGHGGALYHIEDDAAGGTGDDLDIRNSTFENNYAYKQGGAAWILIRGNGSITNSTFASNRASELNSGRVGQGGALVINRGAIPIVSSTFANNLATFQGGALFATGSSNVTLTNSLFANNTLDPNQTVPFNGGTATTEFQGYQTNRTLSGSGNLQFPRRRPGWGNNDIKVTNNPDPVFDDPLLQALADNGGSTRTFALGDGSAAINAGVAGCPATDQRGEARVDACDIGAFEYQGVLTSPTISGTPDTTVNADAAYSFVPIADDPDGDPLTFSITNEPTWATFDTATGELSGTPAFTDIGASTGIVITIEAGGETASLPAFDIEVINPNAPTIAGTPDTTVTSGEVYAFTPTASDADNAPSPLTFSIINKPTWATFDTSTGELTGTPTLANVGSTTGIVITVSDGASDATLPAFDITVTDGNTPTIAGTPAATAQVGSAYTFTPTVSDPNGDTLTFSIVNAPTWATFNTATGQLSGTPTEADVGVLSGIEISVSDGTNTATLAPFSLTVINPVSPSTLTFSVGVASPSSITVIPGATNVPVLQVVVTATGDTATLTVLTVSLGQAERDLSSINTIKLYRDTNANGRVDADEPLLATAAPPTPTTATTPLALTLNSPLAVPVGSPMTLLVVYDLGAF